MTPNVQNTFTFIHLLASSMRHFDFSFTLVAWSSSFLQRLLTILLCSHGFSMFVFENVWKLNRLRFNVYESCSLKLILLSWGISLTLQLFSSCWNIVFLLMLILHFGNLAGDNYLQFCKWYVIVEDFCRWSYNGQQLFIEISCVVFWFVCFCILEIGFIQSSCSLFGFTVLWVGWECTTWECTQVQMIFIPSNIWTWRKYK